MTTTTMRGCLYGDTPRSRRCGAKPTHHILTTPPGSTDPIQLISCEQHAPTARTTGNLKGEHPYHRNCGHPAGTWLLDTNTCGLDPIRLLSMPEDQW